MTARSSAVASSAPAGFAPASLALGSPVQATDFASPHRRPDRLSALPAELIDRIFSFAFSAYRAQTCSVLCLLSKRLLPFGYRVMYRCLLPRRPSQLQALMRTMLSPRGAELGALVHVLKVDMGKNKWEGVNPFTSRWKADKFWGRLTELKLVSMGIQGIYSNSVRSMVASLMQLNVEGREGMMAKLVAVGLRLEADDALDGATWTNLRAIAPNIKHITINWIDHKGDALPLQSATRSTSSIVEGADAEFTRWELESFKLKGTVSARASQVLAFLRATPTLASLALTDDRAGDLVGLIAAVDLPQLDCLELTTHQDGPMSTITAFESSYPLLTALNWNISSSTTAADLVLSQLPRGLIQLRLGPHCAPSLAAVRALVLPGARKLRKLEELTILPNALLVLAPSRIDKSDGTIVLRADPRGEPIFEPLDVGVRTSRPQWYDDWTPKSINRFVDEATEQGVKVKRLNCALKAEALFLKKLARCEELRQLYQRGQMGNWITDDEWWRRRGL